MLILTVWHNSDYAGPANLLQTSVDCAACEGSYKHGVNFAICSTNIFPVNVLKNGRVQNDNEASS